jgi:hypothetical protein
MFREQLAEALPDAKGEFALRSLRAGTYRLTVTLPSNAWYLRAITLAANPQAVDSHLISDGIMLNTQSISGLTFTISEGAARVRGNVTAAEGQKLSERALIYLVPAEKEATNNLFRYFEARSETDGAFDVRNVPPGEYLLVAMKR